MKCITLLTDFGLKDGSVASAKAILMQYVADVPVIDLSHTIEPFHLQQAAYVLTTVYGNFPDHTVHLILFDVFSEKKPRLVLCRKGHHYFLAPDNGILSLAFQADEVWTCFEMQQEHSFADWIRATGSIIHKLQHTDLNALGFNSHVLKNAPQHWLPNISDSKVECQVIHIDRFENVVVNLTREQFEQVRKGRMFRIQFMRNEEISRISKHYSDERDGEKLCRFNSAGYLEISINRGKAASLLGLRLQSHQHLMYNTIKIFFE